MRWRLIIVMRFVIDLFLFFFFLLFFLHPLHFPSLSLSFPTSLLALIPLYISHFTSFPSCMYYLCYSCFHSLLFLHFLYSIHSHPYPGSLSPSLHPLLHRLLQVTTAGTSTPGLTIKSRADYLLGNPILRCGGTSVTPSTPPLIPFIGKAR